MQKHSLGNVTFDLSVLYKVYQIHGWASTPLIMWLVSNVSGLGRRHWGDNEGVWCRRIRWGVDSWNYGIDLVSIFYYYYVFLLLLPFVMEVLAAPESSALVHSAVVTSHLWMTFTGFLLFSSSQNYFYFWPSTVLLWLAFCSLWALAILAVLSRLPLNLWQISSS